MIQNRPFLILLLLTNLIFAQKSIIKIPDSLKKKNYNYLDNKIEELKNDSASAAVYLFTYLYKAKKEKNCEELLNAYQNIMYLSPEKQRLVYADSMIYVAAKSKDNALMGSAYLSKGIVYYARKQLQNALENFTVANNYISRTHNQYLIYKVKYNIANIKSYLGYYDEAISLFRECVLYYKDKNTRPYLNSLHSLGLCYNKIGNYGLCSQTNDTGLSESTRLNYNGVNSYFMHSEGINQFFKENYQLSIQNIESALPEIIKYEDFANESIGYFYIGKSYWKLKKYELALPYFEKVDQIFLQKGYIRPDIREVYELMIHYYKTNDNLQAQLYCIDQLLKADNYLNEEYKNLVSKIHKEYNTKELLFEKEKIQQEVLRDKRSILIFIGVISLLLVIVISLGYRHYKNKKIYRQNYEELMQIKDSHNTIKLRQKNGAAELTGISPETVNLILKQLEKFEKDQKYLEKNITISRLSTLFNINPKYISNIISHYKSKGFTKYVNDLKIDHLIDLLKTDKRIRNYTYSAMAEEIGFSSTERFRNAFVAHAGFPPEYFIRELKKEIV